MDSTHSKIKFYIIFILFFPRIDIKNFANGGVGLGLCYPFRKMRKSQVQYPF